MNLPLTEIVLLPAGWIRPSLIHGKEKSSSSRRFKDSFLADEKVIRAILDVSDGILVPSHFLTDYADQRCNRCILDFEVARTLRIADLHVVSGAAWRCVDVLLVFH